MSLLSVDPGSKKIGLFVKTGPVHWKDTAKVTGEAPLVFIKEYVWEIVSRENVTHALIEGFAYANQRPALSEAVGVIKLVFQQERVKYLEVPISTWQMYMTKGFPKKNGRKAGDAEYLAAVYKKYGRSFDDTDQADAWMMYAAAKMIFSGVLLSEAARKLRDKMLSMGFEEVMG